MLHVKLNKRPEWKGFDQLMDGFLSEWPRVFHPDFNGPVTKGSVPVNVKETATGYELELVAPGFEKTDFTISLDKNLLTIGAEKKNEVMEDNLTPENEKWIRREYSFRSFKRTFTVDEAIDATKIAANYINGVLTVGLPKKEEVKPAATTITVN